MTKKKPLKVPHKSDEKIIAFPPQKSEKISELLNLLNNTDRNLRFWNDKNQFGDIVGIVPVIRVIEEKLGSIYFEYINKKDDYCCKFIVIDISLNKNNSDLNESDIKKGKMIENQGMLYIKSNDIKQIFDIVMSIQ